MQTAQEQDNGTEVVRPETEEKAAEINGLKAVLQAKEEHIALLKDQIERERINAERWHTAYEQKLLPAPAQPPANTNLPLVTQPKPGFFARLFGRSA